MDSDLQQRLVEASVARTKLRKDVVQNLFILKQLSHISQLRREGFARASANAYESDTTKQLREDLSDVLSRIESLQEVVVDNKKSKENFVNKMSEEMHEMARSLSPESRHSRESTPTMSLSSLASSRMGTPIEGAMRNVVWSPHRIDSMSSVLQRARVALQLKRQEILQDGEEKEGRRIREIWFQSNNSSSSAALPGFLQSVDQTVRRRRRSQLLAAAKNLAICGSKVKEAPSEKKNIVPSSDAGEYSTSRRHSLQTNTITKTTSSSAAASKNSVTAHVASQLRKYNTAQVLASGGALRCVECHAGNKALQTDLDEDGQPFLYCESCWEEFYKERFDGTRLSSLK